MEAPQTASTSPGWASALPAGPDMRVKITEAYAMLVAPDAYFWFYLLVGPNWHGEVPQGITKVFRSTTNTGFCAPRVFQDDTPEDKKAIQSVLPHVLFYPLGEFDGSMKSKDWNNMPKAPAQTAGDEESRWVFVDQLPAVLADRRRCQVKRHGMRKYLP